MYQLVDFYSLFYLKFIKNHTLTERNSWLKKLNTPTFNSWSGYAFEQLGLYHLQQIKVALGISGIETQTASWKSTVSENGAQIDLVIDRKDGVINLCEMKFSVNPFVIDKKYDAELKNKLGTFITETKTRKAVFLSMITTYGLQQNLYSGNIQNELKMDVLFQN